MRLLIELDAESVAAVRAVAALPELRGDHVTLAHDFEGDPDPSWTPGGARVGDVVRFDATGVARDHRVQALVVSIGGSPVRPSDGGILHVTVSRAPDARSKDSNDLLASATLAPVSIELRGTIVLVP